jgi:hypothetical protein
MTVNSAVKTQLDATFRALSAAIDQIPEEHWTAGDIDYLIPARHLLHAIDTSAGYLDDGEPDWHRADAFFGRGLDWEGTPAAELPERARMREYLEHERARVGEWLASKSDEQLLAPQETCVWTGPNLLSRCIYLIRHTQAHVQEINAELRRRGLPRIAWVA